MFGGSLEVPKYVKRTKPDPMQYDIQFTHITPEVFGHLGRQPNTDYHVKLLHYKQRQKEMEFKYMNSEAQRLLGEVIRGKYDRHAEKKYFQLKINDRVKAGIRQYEETLEKRQEKLKKLLCCEDQQYYYETVDQTQRGAEFRLEEMRRKTEQFKAEREKERLKVVYDKRLELFKKNSQELRPFFFNQNLRESKQAQLMQMKEKQAQLEKERELDKMWHELMLKEVQAKEEREKQLFLQKDLVQKEILKVWEKQVEGKEILKRESEQVAADDREEMRKLQEDIRKEEIAALHAKWKKRQECAKELHEQIVLQERLVENRKKEDEALEDAFAHLAMVEVEKEKAKLTNKSEVAKREIAIYREHLRQLEKERKEEEKQLDQMLEIYRKQIESKQDEAKCDIVKARQKLHEEVLAGRAEQLELKRQEAEHQLKLKEAENELLRLDCEAYERLQIDREREQVEVAKQYGRDLIKQIEENNVIREQKQKELEKLLQVGLDEEETYRKIIEEYKKGNLVEPTVKHPFRRVLENYCKPCP